MCTFNSTIYDCDCIIQGLITRCSQYYLLKDKEEICTLDSAFNKATGPCPRHKEPNLVEETKRKLSKPWISSARRASRNAALKKRRAKKANKAKKRKTLVEKLERTLKLENVKKEAARTGKAESKMRGETNPGACTTSPYALSPLCLYPFSVTPRSLSRYSLSHFSRLLS